MSTSNFINRDGDKPKPVHIEQLGLNPTSSPLSYMASGFLDDSNERDAQMTAFGSSSVVTEVPQRGRKRTSVSAASALKLQEADIAEEPIPKGVEMGRPIQPHGGGTDHEPKPSRGHGVMSTAPPEHQPLYQPKHAAQLPTHERPSGSSVGVGSLPGNNTEFGVARLPDERGSGNPYIHSHSSVAATTFSPHSSPFKTAFGKTSKAATNELPTEEIPSGSSVGVGSLPGDIREPGVATLPEERENGRPYGTGRTGFENYSPAGRPLQHERGRNLHISAPGMVGTQHNPGPQSAGMGDVHDRIHHHFTEGDHHAMSKWELPSKEEPSGARCGVGSLPGSNKEAGVAILPDEVHPQVLPPPDSKIHAKIHHHFAEGVDQHAMWKWDAPSKEEPSGARCGVGSLPGSMKEAGVAVLPDERRLRHLVDVDGKTSSMRTTQQMPSSETPSGSTVGVGSLPGKANERGVALLPEERLHPADDILMSHLPPRMDQMPSMEHPSGSKVGVGSLPGANTEQGVALTPEERIHPESEIYQSHERVQTLWASATGRHHQPRHPGKTHKLERAEHALESLSPEERARREQMPSTEHPSISRGGVGSLPGKRSEQGVALTPEERLHPADEILGSHLPPRMDQMPSKEHISGSTVGVGSLPGKRSEQSVALTPEERLHPADEILGSHLPPRMDQMPSREHPTGSLVGVGSLPGQRNEKGVVLTPEERHHPADQILMTHRKEGHRRPHFPSHKSNGGAPESHEDEHDQSGSTDRRPSHLQRRSWQRSRSASAKRLHRDDEDKHEASTQDQSMGRGAVAAEGTHGQEAHHRRSSRQMGRGHGKSHPHLQPPQNEAQQSEQSHEEAEREAKIKGEERAEMLRKTMDRVSGDVRATVEGVGKGIEGVKQRVKQSFGWGHPGDSHASPAASGGPPVLPHMPQFWSHQAPQHGQKDLAMPAGFDRSDSGGGSGAIHSNLSPTAPEFVPHLSHEERSGESLSGVGQQPAEGVQAGSTWWPGAGVMPAVGEAVRDVGQKISGRVSRVEDYIHIGHQEGSNVQNRPSFAADNTPEGHRTPTNTTTMNPTRKNLAENVAVPQPIEQDQDTSFDVEDSSSEDELAARQLREVEEMLQRTKLEEEKAGVTFMPYSGDEEAIAPPQSFGASTGGIPVAKLGDRIPTRPAAGRLYSSPMSSTCGMVEPLPTPASGGDSTPSERLSTDEEGAPFWLGGYEIDKEEGGSGKVGDETVRRRTSSQHHHQGHQHLHNGRHGMGHPSEYSATLTGAQGVDFTMNPGENGQLPGYPTQAGMSKLVRDRIMDDWMRAAASARTEGVQTKTEVLKREVGSESGGPFTGGVTTGMTRVDSDLSTCAVRGSSSDLILPGSTTPRTTLLSGMAPARGEGRNNLDIGALGEPLPPPSQHPEKYQMKTKMQHETAAQQQQQRSGIN